MPEHRRILLLVSTGVFMSTMDSSMVNVALPTLMKVFSSSLATTEWVVLMYLLTISVTLLFWGSFSRRIGQGILYTRGLLVFSIGSLCCSLAPSMAMLIFFRFVQATGASMMMAMGPALIKSSFPPGKLGQGLGLIGVATSLGLMTGPAVSGVLLRWSHWRFIFLITVPVGLLVYFAFRSILAAIGSPVTGGTGDEKRGFDFSGGLLYAGAVVMTVLLLAHATATCCRTDWHGWPLYQVVAVLLVWIFFFVYELRKKNPLFPVPLFGNRFYSMAMMSAMLSFTVLFFVLLLMPFYLSAVRGFPSDQVGYFMMAVPLCVFFVAPLAGRLHDIIGARIIASAGLSCCLISLVLLTRLSVMSSGMYIVSALALLGFGQAMFLAPNSAAALAGVPHEESGVTSSLLATSRNMGMLLGTALAGLIFARVYARLTGGMDIRDFTFGQSAQFMQALQQTFKAGAWIGVLAVSASFLRGRSGRAD